MIGFHFFKTLMLIYHMLNKSISLIIKMRKFYLICRSAFGIKKQLFSTALKKSYFAVWFFFSDILSFACKDNILIIEMYAVNFNFYVNLKLV